MPFRTDSFAAGQPSLAHPAHLLHTLHLLSGPGGAGAGTCVPLPHTPTGATPTPTPPNHTRSSLHSWIWLSRRWRRRASALPAWTARWPPRRGGTSFALLHRVRLLPGWCAINRGGEAPGLLPTPTLWYAAARDAAAQHRSYRPTAVGHAHARCTAPPLCLHLQAQQVPPPCCSAL